MSTTVHRTASAEQTRELGAKLGRVLSAGDVILLVGDLGAGKTTFVQGVAQGLGVEGRVTSPTYIVARTHDSISEGPGLVHVDAYRLEDDLDLETIDLDSTLAESVTIIEWGRGVAEVLSADRLEVEFAFDESVPQQADDEGRRIVFRPVGDQWVSRLEEGGLA